MYGAVVSSGLVAGLVGGFVVSFTPAAANVTASEGLVTATAQPRSRQVTRLSEPEHPCPPLPVAPELHTLTSEVETLQGALSEVEADIASLVGEAASFEGLPVERQPLAMEQRLQEVLDELGQGEIYYVDCSEQPCVAVVELEVPSFDREHFGEVTDAVVEAFGTSDLNFWASSEERGEEGVVVHVGLPLDHRNGEGENPRRNQHRVDQLLWDAHRSGSTP